MISRLGKKGALNARKKFQSLKRPLLLLKRFDVEDSHIFLRSQLPNIASSSFFFLNLSILQEKSEVQSARSASSKSNDDVVKEKEVLVKEKATLTKEKENLVKEKADLSESLKKAQVDAQDAVKQLSTLKQQLAQSNETLSKQIKQHSDLSDTIRKQGASDVERVQVSLNVSEQKQKELQQQVQQHQQTINNLKKESIAEAARVKKLTKDEETLQAQLADKQTEIKGLKETAKTSSQSLSDTAEAASSKSKDANGRIAQLEEQLKAVQAQYGQGRLHRNVLLMILVALIAVFVSMTWRS
jgi:chromosome segregation protein